MNPEENQPNQAPVQPAAENVMPEKPKHKKRLIILVSILVGLILAGAVGGIGYYVYLQNQKISQLQQQGQNNSKTTPAVTKPVVADVTWITPQKVNDLGFFNSSSPVYKDYYVDNTYYKVATTKDGGEIYLVESDAGMLGFNYYRFKKVGNNYLFLKSISSPLFPDSGYLKSSVQTDTSTTYSGLTAPKSLALKNGTSFSNGTANKLFSQLTNTSKIEDTSFGTFYVSKDSNSGQLTYTQNRNFYLKLADSTTYKYSMELPYYSTDSYIPNITINGSQNTVEYSDYIIPSCGSFDSTIITDPAANISNLTSIGNTSAGGTVFAISNINSNLAKEIYAVYKNTASSGLMGTDYSSLTNLTIEQFYNLKPQSIIVIQDGLGQDIVFLRHEFKGMGGCGKPVIYLYPTKEMPVAVKVGANVTTSIPDYNQGWKVLASPNGTIKLDDKTYDYLFWEGQGNGSYPSIDRGFIVKQADLKQAINDQLTKLGLNSKERGDFTDFWMTKLPKTPYVRLTWLTTADMNQVAPLTISPKPDTLIRVFLDYEGLQKPISIKPEGLHTIVRKGFTVVEWGGLKTW